MLPLTPAILSALAEGITQLERGDDKARETARGVRATVASKLDLVLVGTSWVSTSEATSGFVQASGGGVIEATRRGGVWVADDYDAQSGRYGVLVEAGTTVFLDRRLEVPLCTVKAPLGASPIRGYAPVGESGFTKIADLRRRPDGTWSGSYWDGIDAISCTLPADAVVYRDPECTSPIGSAS